jgi:U32 family peptidase
MKEIEIMAPAGNFECLIAAIKAGAGSVYFGCGPLNMRANSAKFTVNDLKEISKICNKNNVKSYLTVNTIIYDDDIKEMKKLCDLAKKHNISSVIASDLAVINYCNKINQNVHLSTQCNVSNIEEVKFYSKFVDVIVLARELTLKQIKTICDKIKKERILGKSGELLQIEAFIHGALCVSISGKCYMSLATYNKSANRGACLQNCRRQYKVTDLETNDELIIDNKFVMSPKDLCTIEIIDKIINAGVTVLKIEGRARSAEYVSETTSVYREAVDSVLEKSFTKSKVKKWKERLNDVFNRGFWENGYYLGEKISEWNDSYGSKSKKVKIQIGKVNNYFNKNKIAEIEIFSNELKVGDEILIIGPTTGVIKDKVKKIVFDNKEFKKISKGSEITIPIKEKVRKNDKLFLYVNRN